MGRGAELAQCDDEALLRLLRARADVLDPEAPASFDELSTWLSSLRSLAEYLQHATEFEVRLTELVAVAARTGHSVVDIAGAGVSPAQVRAGIRGLVGVRVLLAGAERGTVTLPRALRSRLDGAGGLGRPATSLLARRPADETAAVAARVGVDCAGHIHTVIGDADRLHAVLAAAPVGARGLAALIAHSPSPQHEPAAESLAEHRWLVEHGLLVGEVDGAAEMPLEVGLALRGGVVYANLRAEPPPADVAPADLSRRLGDPAGDAVRRVVGQMEVLGCSLSTRPAPMLRSGGVGIRARRAITARSGLEECSIEILLCLGRATGLFADDPTTATVAPTARLDEWLGLDHRDRFAVLVAGWLTSTRPAMVELLGHDATLAEPAGETERRMAVLRELVAVGEDGVADPSGITARVLWRRPALWAQVVDPHEHVQRILTETDVLGLRAGGSSTRFAAALVPPDAEGGPDVLHALAADAFGASVDRLTVLADATVVVPGRPTPELARALGAVADVVSRGGAVVYRLTPASVGRALLGGADPDQIAEMLRSRSGRELAPTVGALLADVAKRHGRIRVGAVGAYVRSEDPVLIAEVLADRALASLGLAPVDAHLAVSEHSTPAELVRTLAEAGHLPAAEDPTGAVVAVDLHRVRAPTPPGHLLDGQAELALVLRAGPPREIDVGLIERFRAAGIHDDPPDAAGAEPAAVIG